LLAYEGRKIKKNERNVTKKKTNHRSAIVICRMRSRGCWGMIAETDPSLWKGLNSARRSLGKHSDLCEKLRGRYRDAESLLRSKGLQGGRKKGWKTRTLRFHFPVVPRRKKPYVPTESADAVATPWIKRDSGGELQSRKQVISIRVFAIISETSFGVGDDAKKPEYDKKMTLSEG